MIKVCHIVNLITGKSDGVYAHLKSIFRNYDRNKFEHFLIFQGGEKIENEVHELGIKVFTSESLKKKISVQVFSDVYNVIKSEKIDIIHTHLIKPYAIAGLTNIFLRKRFIFNYHGIFLKNNPYYNFIERSIYSVIHYFIYLFGNVDAVLVPSKKNKELLLSETKLFPESVVYYNGYSLNQNFSGPNADLKKQIQEIKKSKLVITVIGRLEVDKRIDRAINLLKNLITEKQNIHVLIFGDGSLKSDLKNLVDELELKKYINFLGYVKEIENYYKLFDIVLFTSHWEGMPLTMWEAMANGIPVVAPDVGGFKEILEENRCGLIYGSGNMEAAEEKIKILLEDEKLRKKIGANGISAVEIKYNHKNFIRQIEQVYSNLLSI
jgi:glycosyltransferase involved in cell wall biosynthesis